MDTTYRHTYRRKSDLIEAQQFIPGSGRWPPGVRSPKADGTYVITINGSTFDVFPYDWITYSEHGMGVCRHDYFRNTYEQIEEADD